MNINFICSLPRAGNTLLGSIINENQGIKCSPNSICTDIVFQLNSLKSNDIYRNFPKESSLDNLIKQSLYEYYKDWESDLILDRGPWGTPDILKILKKIFIKPKFVILLRPLIECLASFAKLQIDNKNYTKNNIDKYLLGLLNFDTGVIGKNICSVNNLLKSNEQYKIFYYTDLVNNIDLFLNNLGNYLNFNLKKPHKLKQYKIGNISYIDDIPNLHKIKIGSIEKSNYAVEDYLNYDMIQFIKNNNPLDI